MKMNLSRCTGLFLMIALLLAQVGCSAGGQITNSLVQPSAPVYIPAPTISQPAETTYYGSSSTLQISGICASGSRILLSGSDSQEQVCENNSYGFTVLKTIDGIYPFMVMQLTTAGLSAPAVLFWIRKATVAPPVIASPAANPYLSATPSLTISGSCESGSTISLLGDGTGSTTCTNSAFSITLTKFADGTYTIPVQQEDLAGNKASINLVWQKISLTASPPAPQLIVAKSQVFTVTGGSGVFSGTLSTNNSGATYDDATRTYTAGQIAGATDVLRFTDTQGNIVNVSILTVPDQPDHFVLPLDSGDGQSQKIGNEFDQPLQIKVVDKYDNPVSGYNLIFGIAGGDVILLDSPRQSTNASGIASVRAKAGIQATRTLISVKPANGALPDEAGTGYPTASLNLLTEMSGTGQLGSAFALGTSPTVTEVADFNGDSFLDVAILNSADPSVGLLYGKGSGLFESMIKAPAICTGPGGMISSDVNADGKLDFIVTCPNAGKIQMILTQEDGSYSPAVNISLELGESFTLTVTTGDFNKDGHLDLVSISRGGEIASLRLGAGDGSFASPTFFAVGRGPSQVDAADLNKDGNLDVVLLNAIDNTVGVLINDGNGGFNSHTAYPAGNAPVALKIFDVDGNGWMDVIVANNGDSTVHALLNDGFGELQAGIISPVSSGPVSLTVKDLNGDSKMDLVTCSADESTLSILLGQGDGTFELQPSFKVLDNPVYIDSGDFNADNQIDLVVISNAERKLQFLPGQGNGNVGFEFSTDPNPSASVLADLDEDGYVDLVVAQKGSNSLRLLKGNGKGLWTPLGTLATNNGPTFVGTADLNTDGHVDLFITHQNATNVRVYLGVGNGTFSTASDYAVGLQAASAVARDLNLDSYPDLVVVNSGSNSVSVLGNAGDGSFLPQATFSVASQPTDVKVADLNGDLYPDLVAANSGSGTVSVLISNGGLSYQTHIEFTAGVGANSLALGFFNNDNSIDVAVANELEGTIGILLGNGNGSLQTVMGFSAGANPKSLIASDFDGDGRQDLIVANGPAQSFTILYGSGNGQFSVSNTQSADRFVDALAIGDIGNDGSVDLISIDSVNSIVNSWMGF